MEFRINVNVDGIGRIAERVTRLGEGVQQARTPISMAMGEKIQETAQEILSQPGQGETWATPLIPSYWRQYSKPSGVSGGPPTSQYGDLSRSIVVRPTLRGNATVVAGEGLYRPYAKWLELGFHTIFAHRSVRFPFLRPATEMATPELRGIALAVLAQFIP
jgi:hypothetical protein